MATEKQITYINSLIDDNRNVPYLAGDAPEDNKKEWIARSLNLPTYWPDDVDDDTFTISHYTLDELMAMRTAKVNEYAALDLAALDNQQSSKVIDALKKMLGRR